MQAMKWKLNLTVFLTLLLSATTFAQNTPEWANMMRDPNANFYDVQASFNAYWNGRTIEKGKGYKAFKRWEYYMAPRVYPSGNLTLPSQNYRNYKQWELDLIQAGTPKSTNGNWTIIGPIGKPTNSGAGRLSFVRFDPSNSTTMYVGAPDGGLWKTTNGGTSWTTGTDQLSMIGVSDVAIDPTNTQIMYLATGDSDGGDTYSIGVLKSTDGGATWNTTGLTWTSSQGRSIGRLLINPTNPSIVMAFSNAGIFRTTNGGTSWSNPTGTFATIDAEFKPGDANTVYACGTAFKKSTDGGATWTAVTVPVTGSQRLNVAVSAANSAYVYLLSTGADFGYNGIMRSTNSGTSFTTMSTTPNILGFDYGSDAGGQGWYDLSLAVSPTNADLVIVGGINHWKSTNGGSSWTQISHWYGGNGLPYVHADVHDIQFLPGSGTTIFSANDGGIFKTTNTGSSWTDLSSNLAIAQQYRFSLSTSSATMILAGHQDNGTNRTTNGTSWTQVGGGDGMDCFIDRTNNNRQISSIYYGDYSRTTTGGTNFADIADPGVQGEWVSPIHQDPTDANIAYAAGRAALYKTANIWATTVSWSTMGTPQGTGSIIEFAIAPSNNQIVYCLKQGSGGVSKSTNGGTSFTSCATPTTSASPTWVAVSNTDPNVVFVAYSGYSAANKVFKSTNGGTSWTNVSTGLPNIPVNCIVYHNGAAGGDGIYIGTDLGVYYRDNSTNAWVDFSNGMPNCAVSDLEIYYATSTLRAATFGRGTWESDLYSAVAAAPVASFTSNTTTVCQGGSVTFTNTSTGVPTSYSWSFSGGTPSTSTDTNPIVTYSTAGTYNVVLTATNASGTNTQTSTAYITVTPVTGQVLPFSEGFTGTTFPPTGWTIVNTDAGDTTWRQNATVGVAPTAGNSMWFDNFNVNDAGNVDEMQTPKLDFTGLSSAQMTFSVAYAAYNATYIDGLDVDISTDCGTTWTNVYSKTGSTVATGNLPTAAAQPTLFTPTATQWRTETIDLTSYIGQSGVVLSFKNVAAYGNALYVDNINITGVSVPTAPTASFTATPSGTSCVGQAVQFTSTSTGSPTSYSWIFPSGTPATSTSQNPTVTWATAGTYTVTLTATNANGSNTTTQSFTVAANPTVTQSAISAVCATASPITLSGGSPAGGTYSGTGVSGGTFNPANASVGSNTVTYTYTNASGCSATATTAITVNAAPSIASTTPGSVCGSGTVTLGATPSAGTVSWYAAASGGTALGTGNTFTTPTISTTTTYYAETTSSGCTSTRVAVVAAVTSAPTVTNPGSQTFCTGTPSQTITFSGSSGSSTYAWTNDNTGIGLGASGTGNITSFTPAGSGISTVTVTPTLSGCVGSPQSFVITVNQTPTATLAPFSAVCVNWSPVALSGGSPAGGTYSGTGVSGGSFNPATAGTFPITYSYTQNGCTGTASSSITVNACASVSEEAQSHLMLYPNPVGNALTLEGEELNNFQQLELVDATGRIVQKWNVSGTKMILDLSRFASGTYSIRFNGKDAQRTERIEIVK